MAIITDFAEIKRRLRGDDWWEARPASLSPEPGGGPEAVQQADMDVVVTGTFLRFMAPFSGPIIDSTSQWTPEKLKAIREGLSRQQPSRMLTAAERGET